MTDGLSYNLVRIHNIAPVCFSFQLFLLSLSGLFHVPLLFIILFWFRLLLNSMDFHTLFRVAVASIFAAAFYILFHRSPVSSKRRKNREDSPVNNNASVISPVSSSPEIFSFTSIGTISSVFRRKYGAPRQGSVIPTARGILTLSSSIPKESLEGLNEYSHIWIIFIFHANTNKKFKARVEPPRLGGQKIGVFGTRSPHRINPIGMSVVKLDCVDINNKQIYISGLDLIDQTPVIDIKPYHPADCIKEFKQPNWMDNKIEYPLTVHFNDSVIDQLTELINEKKLKFYHTLDEIIDAIRQSASLDPRPVYLRKRQSSSEIYGYDLDRLNIQHTIDENNKLVTIVQVFLYPHDQKGIIKGDQLRE
jgi:tRNA-Thr(GGU) m(6)t(6)A37 methyltransferase TsaA